MSRPRSLALLAGVFAAVALPGCGEDASVTTTSTRDTDGNVVAIEKAGGSVEQIEARDARDESAKRTVRDAQTAIETYYTEYQSYEGADTAELASREPSLADTGSTAWKSDLLSKEAYRIEATSESGAVFDVVREPDGTISRRCKPVGSGGCDSSGRW
jgi:transposase-like protein